VLLAPLEISAVFRMQKFTAQFAGASGLEGVVPYTDATLKDWYVGGYLTAGVGF
jgi:hypothetical protein